MKKFFRASLILKASVALLALLLFRAAFAASASQPVATTEPASASASPADETTPSLSLVDLFWKAGVFIWPLSACSVLTVALIIERFIALRRRRFLPPEFLPGLFQVIRDPIEERERALQYCVAHDCPLARVIAAGLRRLPRGYAAAEKAIEDAGGNEVLKLRQNMRFLYSLGSVATLLGLIGTIWGMIKAFQNASIQGPGHVQALSEGIYTAMVNTFAGLAIAIVVTIFYYYFAGHIEKLVLALNEAVNGFGREAGFDASPSREAAATAPM
jgi:biopolymer transport protein ExbB